MGRPTKKRHAPTLRGDREKKAKQDFDVEKYEAMSETQRKERIDQIVRTRQEGRKLLNTAAQSNTSDDLEPLNVGMMDQRCPFSYCAAKLFNGEKVGNHYTICCGNGKVDLPEESRLQSYPEYLKYLLTSSDVDSKNFREFIRNYNSALAFASITANLEDHVRGGGPYTFKIHGAVYTRTSNLIASGAPVYSQLFIVDSQTALDQRMGRTENDKCLPHVMSALDQVIRDSSPYAAAYRNLMTVASETADPMELQLIFRKDTSKDNRRFNEPTANEVFAVFRGSDGCPPDEIDFAVYLTDGSVMNISHTSPNSDPMAYPLLFPSGERGWRPGLQHHSEHRTACRTRLTMLDFYKHRIAVRDGFSSLHNGAKLFQQYVVLSYVKIESNNLFFLRTNQSKLRVECYKGLMDALASDAAANERPLGRVFILPSTFSGSPRNMQQNYQDAMAIVNKFKKPDFFITFTCNPKWPEIVGHLEYEQRPEGRPDLIARVFHLKLKELIRDVKERAVLGHVVAMVHVIEFQKRGLPHAHLLIILANDSKIRGREMIDEFVCAEVPDPVRQPALHAAVLRHMIHGPCGGLNQKSVCMKLKACSKNFPKDFTEETQENVDGYPVYRRRQGTTFEKRGAVLDNRWVVPYNPFLLLKYDAHINVEICSSVRSVKYLYKYVYKGHDCVDMELHSGPTTSLNEIDQYIDGRSVTPPEAAWRLFEFKMHEQSHSIMRLPVHLPFEQSVVFKDNSDLESVVEKSTRTALTAFFDLCQNCPEASDLLYPQVGEQFILGQGKHWKPRQRGFSHVISRMYNVSPLDRERYFLRILLLNVKGPTSFDDLRTVKGKVHGSFFEAAKALNLLADDEEWSRCLEEAAQYKMPEQMRKLFVMILTFCQPQNPDGVELFRRFRDDLCEDFRRDNSEEVATTLCLHDVQRLLQVQKKRLSDFGFEHISAAAAIEETTKVDVQSEEEEGQRLQQMLNKEQDEIVDLIIAAVMSPNSRTGNLFFMDGPAGTGKTFIYNTLMSILRGRHKSVIPVALTGIAATLLKGGRTAHSCFKLPVPLNETSVSSIDRTSADATKLLNCDLFIWDEAPMAPGIALTVVDRLLRDLTENHSTPFGGKVFLFGGDFRQCLPVLPRAGRAAITGYSLKRNRLWQHFHQLRLSRNMRADQRETSFMSWLLQLGSGQLESHPDFGDDSFEVPIDCIVEEAIEDVIYGSILHPSDWQTYAKYAILTPCNEASLRMNDAIVDKLDGEAKIYKSVDEVVCDTQEEARNYPTEFINSLTPSGLPPHELKLKVGTIIMLLRNLDSSQGLCNGTRLIVTRLHDNMIEARRFESSEPVFIPRIHCVPATGDPSMPFVLKRRQFPIRSAFVVTINKSQGQTFDKIGLYLPEPAFGHGQIYVAFSRVKKFDDIKVQLGCHNGQGIADGKYWTQNIVYKEIL